MEYDFEIQHVRLREQSVRIGDEVDIENINRETTVVQSICYLEKLSIASYDLKNESNVWRYTFNVFLGARVVEQHMTDEDHEGLVTIISGFDVAYDNKQLIELDESNYLSKYELDPLKAAWPYWLELVSNSCQRIGYYPPIKTPHKVPELYTSTA